jgi:ribosomal protein S18 acetylase RimI-like enzyme
MNRQWAHVKSVSVSEAHRGRGLGPLLFTELFAFAARLGIPEVRLEAEVLYILHCIIIS